jgi:hypothetical protein
MKHSFIIILILLTLASYSQDTSTIEFAQVYYNKAWRIIDKRGNFILNQGYGVGSYQSLCFGDKLAVSYQNKKFGFTDFTNKQVIPNKFDFVQCFVLGYAPVAVDKKWGIINKEGKFVVEPIYDYVGVFALEKVAPVIKDGKIGLVDTTGKLVTPFKYYWKIPFATHPDYPFFINGLITVIDAKDPEKIYEGKAGCMNTKGELVIPAIYDYISYFINGIATAKKDDKIVLIDTLGNIVLEPKGVDYGALYFDNGFAVFHKQDGRTGMIKMTGEIILEPKYNGVEPFSEGFAAVQISGDENGVTSAFIDTTGKFVFGKTFGFIRGFNEGFAAVEVNGKWGFIDKTGKIIIETKYFWVEDFQDGLAIVGIKRGKQVKYGYIDTTGKFVLNPIYNEAGYFQYGLAPVKIGNKFGYIDKSGKVMISPKFDNAHSFQRERLGWAQ